MFACSSLEGIGLCTKSCCWSFVVVILVSSPATISMMSATGIALISYCVPASEDRCLIRGRLSISSLAKLWICDKSLTLIRLGDVASEPPNDLVDRYVGCSRGEFGESTARPPGSLDNGKPD